MQIYVVRSGDTLWGISRAFGVAAADIVSANELPEPDNLVVGQALVIPITGSYYWVAPRDTLYLIGQRFGIDYQELARINNIYPVAQLSIGTRIYIPPRPKYRAEVNAYIEPPGAELPAPLLSQTNQAAPYLTYFAPFSYTANSDGTINAPYLAEVPAIAKANGAALMLVVTNIENGAFSETLAGNVLSDLAVQDTLLNNILAEAEAQGVFTDIHFDFEFIPAANREDYSAFLTRAATFFRPKGYLVSAALAPKTSAAQSGQWYEAHDYRAIGEAVDFVVIMTYEWGYSGGPPMPVSPIGPVERVLRYALTEMPASKILMGQNLYGYDWTLPYVQGNPQARALSPQVAIEIARNNRAAILYDYNAEAPYFNYTAQGSRHIVWFEDARSIQAKLDLLRRLGLRGISYWRLGFAFPQNWLLAGSNLDVVKR